MRNLYGVLGIKPSASAEEMKAAYRKLAMQHHPDRNPGGDARFKEIGAAYEVLSDAETREQFDRAWREWLRARNAFPCEGCGGGVRVPAGASGRLRCHTCKHEFVVQAPSGNSGAEVPSMMASVATTLRRHGERLGNQVLVETSAIAEQITDEMVTEAAVTAAQGIRTGFARLRKHLGLTEEMQESERELQRKRRARTTAISRRKE